MLVEHDVGLSERVGIGKYSDNYVVYPTLVPAGASSPNHLFYKVQVASIETDLAGCLHPPHCTSITPFPQRNSADSIPWGKRKEKKMSALLII